MQKRTFHFILRLSFSTFLCSLLVQGKALTQEREGCFGVLSSGRLVDLNPLCEHKRMQDSDNRVSPQEIYQRGFDKARKRLYQEAVFDFNQAISANPDFPEAYIARAYAQAAIKKYQEAAKDFEQAAEIYKGRGDLERAKMLQKSIQDARQFAK